MSEKSTKRMTNTNNVNDDVMKHMENENNANKGITGNPTHSGVNQGICGSSARKRYTRL